MSVRENEYSKVVSGKTDAELLLLMTEHEKYVDELLEAAILEMQKRGLQHPLIGQIESNIRHTEEIQEEIPIPEEIISEEKIQPVLPPLYSQNAILGFTLLLSPLFGGIMLAMNVWRVYKKGVLPVIIFSVVFTLVIGYTSVKVQKQTVLDLLLPLAGALILSNVLRNKYIGRQVQYEKRSILIPAVIALLIIIPVTYIAYTHPELIPIPQNLNK